MEDHIYSPFPVDEVVRQSPPAGMRVKVGQYAHVVLSLGPQNATIPLLERTQPARRANRIAARAECRSAKFHRSIFPALERRTRCCGRIPRREKRTSPVPHVNLLVSLGLARVVRDARTCGPHACRGRGENVGSAGCKLASSLFVPTSGAPHGVVLRSPSADPAPRFQRVEAEQRHQPSSLHGIIPIRPADPPVLNCPLAT